MRRGCRAVPCAPLSAAGRYTNTCDRLAALHGGRALQFFISPMSLPYFIATLLVGYLFGSIPFGLIVTRLAGSGDIRNVGSGKIGATNVLRPGRKGLAVATLVGDMLKGTAAVLLVNWYTGAPEFGLVAGFGAVV